MYSFLCQNRWFRWLIVTLELYLIVSVICYCYLAMLGYCIGLHCFTAPYKNGSLTDSFSRNVRNLAVDVIVSSVRNIISCILVYFNCVPTRLQKTLVSSLLLISCIDKSQALIYCVAHRLLLSLLFVFGDLLLSVY